MDHQVLVLPALPQSLDLLRHPLLLAFLALVLQEEDLLRLIDFLVLVLRVKRLLRMADLFLCIT